MCIPRQHYPDLELEHMQPPHSSFQAAYLPQISHYSDVHHYRFILPVSELCINGTIQIGSSTFFWLLLIDVRFYLTRQYKAVERFGVKMLSLCGPHFLLAQ